MADILSIECYGTLDRDHFFPDHGTATPQIEPRWRNKLVLEEGKIYNRRGARVYVRYVFLAPLRHSFFGSL